MGIPDAAQELAGVDLGDRRLNTRAQEIVTALQANPTLSFPRLYAKDSALQAHYRFTNNARVTAPALLAPHANATWTRAGAASDTLVLHDTTSFSFPGEGEREGLVREGKNRQVFSAHLALAVAEGDAPVVHGVVGMRAYIVDRGSWCEVHADGSEEELLSGAQRWIDLAHQVRAQAPPHQRLIHVMDREADDYALWTRLIEQGDHFVIRASHNRSLADRGKLQEALAEQAFTLHRDVHLSRRSKLRPPKTRKSHPDRDQRAATLGIRAGIVEVRRPAGVAPLGQPTMRLSVVEVIEVDPPAETEAVRWMLVSSLPVDTPQAISRIVDIYRKRWLIEEYNKSIKTGCAFEKRQAESQAALVKTLALVVPVAWRLLVLRAHARENPTAPGSTVLDEVEMEALRTLVPHAKLPKKPSARQVLIAVAQLGGFLKSNGEPGWITLGAGLQRLLEFTAGWRAALDHLKHQHKAGGSEM